MSRSIRAISLAAAVASALTLSPAALAGGGKTADSALRNAAGSPRDGCRTALPRRARWKMLNTP